MTMTDPTTAGSNATAEGGQGSAPIQQAPGLQDMAPKDTGAAFNDPFHDRRQSDEWDASKVPPSRFQKRKGSIYSTPGSRDGHVDRNTQHKFHETHAEKGYGEKK
ncbi:hypothetical protein MCOR25_002694 [Pyricularia grisea]|uniref:Uncharacterized protein n=1 Tax=Pyricularia grisea TaxID=148305 RepID=A0A6P8BBU1_PYRGI|nr:uncharacterized protein PgNI_03262 [Pyricularia grisea]KAI6376729.1 hypothetical protein MCOR25_002694 [Pyricularia grisea]TLD13269.1 hypothetical protein PgNI_03262 [Pyricularia grisea]